MFENVCPAPKDPQTDQTAYILRRTLHKHKGVWCQESLDLGMRKYEVLAHLPTRIPTPRCRLEWCCFHRQPAPICKR
jgi:hypothetical protein